MDTRQQVVAISDGFFNAALHKAGEVFYVEKGQELGATWFRPVLVSSIPQGPKQPEPPFGPVAPKADLKVVAVPQPQTKAKPQFRKKSDHDLD